MNGLEIKITISPQGQVNISGPLDQPLVMYGALKMGEQALAAFYAKQQNGKSIVPRRMRGDWWRGIDVATVYVLTTAFDYEGESAVGVYGQWHVAIKAAEKMAAERGYEGGQWVNKSQPNEHGVYELAFGSTQFIVRSEPIRES